jgi:ferredoxin--NADP+ reductase
LDKILNNIKLEKTKFIEKVKEANGTFTFKFEILKNLSWTEGTHFHIAFPDFIKDSKPDKDLVRSFSIMSLNEENCLAFTTRIKEHCSVFKQRLFDLKSGDEMFIFKIGNNIEVKNENKSVVFISMGVGIATFRPLIKKYIKSPSLNYNLTNINVDSSKSYLFKGELESSNKDGLSNIYVDSRKELYQQIDVCLNNRDTLYYVVGSDDFLKNIISYLIYNSVKKNNIFIDKKMDLRKTFL